MTAPEQQQQRQQQKQQHNHTNIITTMVKKGGKTPRNKRPATRASAISTTKKNGLLDQIKTGVAVVIGLCVFAFVGRTQDTTDLSLAVADSNTATRTSISIDQKSKQKRRKHPLFDPSWDIFQQIEAEQTGRVFAVGGPPEARPPEARPLQRTCQFLEFHSGVSQKEAYSGSWLQRTSDFMTMALDKMERWEDAAYFAYHDEPNDDRGPMLKMPMDYLDFSVEHLSSWWGMLKVFENDIPFNTAISKLENYIKGRGPAHKLGKYPTWQGTIAVIAFKVYADSSNPPGADKDKIDKLSSLSLAATMESLRRAGFGRVVVVGMEDGDEKLTQDPFQYIGQSNVAKALDMEVAFARGSREHVDDNVPKAALLGLREAFQISDQDATQRSPEQSAHLKTWLGDTKDSKYWEYVYLTEHDSILQSRPSSLEKLKEEVDKGSVLLPHRLQPIPHESDVSEALRRDMFLPRSGDFSDVMEVDGDSDTCCDENWGPDRSPGKPPNFPDCGKPWYECEFGNPELPVENRPHERLKVYKLIRLKHGTGTTLLAGTEEGRRCLPKKDDGGCLVKE